VTTTDDDNDDKSTKIWVGNLRERDHLENLSVDREVNIKQTYKKDDMVVQSELFWLRTGTNHKLL
jgi:hypothetical protein